MELASIQKLNPAGQDVAVAQYGDDTGLYVEFYMRPVKNEKRSLEEGRPIFEDREYIKILSPGDKTKQWDRPVRKLPQGNVPSDLDRFSKQWLIFQRQGANVVEGTPITEWAAITRSDAESFKAMSIHTVEQMAQLGDHQLGWTGARAMRDKAQKWLEKSKDGAEALRWAQEKQELQDQINALKNQMNGFGIQEASAPPAKRKKVKHEQDIPSTNAGSGQ